jgi:hypothetical protein
MNITQVNQAIMHGNFTNDELSSIIDAVKYGRARLTREIKRGLAVGDNVNFNSTKLGRNVTGVITKIAIKYVTVRTATGLWRVPANMLTRIDEPEFA